MDTLRRGQKNNIKGVVIALSAGCMFWLLDALVNAYVHGEGSFFSQLFLPQPLSLWMRLFMLMVMGLFAFILYARLNQPPVRENEDKSIDANQVRLAQLEETLTQRELQLKTQDESFQAGLAEFKEKEKTLLAKEQQMAKQEEFLRDKILRFSETQESLGKKEAEYKVQEQAFDQAKERLQTKEAALAERESRLNVQEADYREKLKEITTLKDTLVSQQKQVVPHDDVQSKKAEELKFQGEDLRQREEKLKSIAVYQHSKGEQLKAAEELLNTREKSLQEKEQAKKVQAEKGAAESHKAIQIPDQEIKSQLAQSSRMSAIGQIASGLSLEMNSPINSILNNIQLIKSEMEQKGDFKAVEFKGLLGVIEDAGLRCKTIIQSFSGFSKACAETAQLMSCNELLNKVTTLVEQRYKLQSITIKKQLQPDLPRIMGDPQLLQLVVFNLIVFARWAIQKKSVREGGIISLSTYYKAGDDEHIRLVISDTGMQVSSDDALHLFDPFYALKIVGEETGLDLSFVRQIVKEHKGEITFESKEEGSTFLIMLPAVKENPQAASLDKNAAHYVSKEQK